MKEVKITGNANNKMTINNVAGFMMKSEIQKLYSMQFHTKTNKDNEDMDMDYESFKKTIDATGGHRQFKTEVIRKDIDEWAFEKHFVQGPIPYRIHKNNGEMIWRKWNEGKKTFEDKPLPTPRNRLKEIYKIRNKRQINKRRNLDRRNKSTTNREVNKRRRTNINDDIQIETH